MKSYLAVLLLFFYCNSYTQDNKKDIERLIDNCTTNISSQPDSAFYYINKAIFKSKKIHDDFLTSRCLYNLGYCCFLQNDFKNAKIHIYESLPYAKKSGNNKITALAYNQLGLMEMNGSNYNASLKNLLFSLNIAEKNNLERNKCNALNNLALLFQLQKDTVKALEYYNQNEKIASQNDFKEILLSNYINIAVLKRKSNKNLTIIYLNKAFDLAKELQDKSAEFNILINLSDVYISLNNNIKAYKCLEDAKNKALEIGIPNNLFFVYFNLGGYYNKLKNYHEAINMYEKALALPKNGISNDQYIDLYGAFSDVYKELGNYKEAYLYQEKYNLGKDSIFNLEKNEAFVNIQTKYEVEKKNLKINLLLKQKEIEKNKKILVISIGIILIIPLLILLLFYKHRIKTQKIISEKETKIHEQEKEKLHQEQELKRIRGVVQGQDEERNRIAKEIHDGVGGNLAGIKLNLSKINSSVKNDAIQIIIAQLSNLFDELRGISHNLSQNYIKDKSFESLLYDLQQEYEKRNEFQTEIIIFPPESLQDLSENIKHQLYRIIQELFANVSKHAKAKNVLINITRHDDSLNIIVEDDGRGFINKDNKGIGLKNIQERLFSINGIMTIETIEGKGSTIIIDIPN